MYQRHLIFAILLASGACVSKSPARTPFERGYQSAAYDRCLASARGVRPIEHCAALEIDDQRRQLDPSYADLLATQPLSLRTLLIRDQNRWDEAMQAHCMVFSRRPGSLNSMKAQACFLDEIISRRRELARNRD